MKVRLICTDAEIALSFYACAIRAVLQGLLRKAGLNQEVLVYGYYDTEYNPQISQESGQAGQELLDYWANNLAPFLQYGYKTKGEFLAEIHRKDGVWFKPIQTMHEDAYFALQVIAHPGVEWYHPSQAHFFYPVFQDPIEMTEFLSHASFQEQVETLTLSMEDFLKFYRDSMEGVDFREKKSEPLPFEDHQTMDSILKDFDLGLRADVSVVEEVLKKALGDCFGGKEINDWNLWLMGCMTAGILSRLPEVAEVYEDMKTT